MTLQQCRVDRSAFIYGAIWPSTVKKVCADFYGTWDKKCATEKCLTGALVMSAICREIVSTSLRVYTQILKMEYELHMALYFEKVNQKIYF